MKFPIGLTWGLASAALVGLMLLAVLGFQAQEKGMQGLRQSNQESIYWDTSQSEAELARFLSTLGRYSIGDPDVAEADVNRRFDILWSRIDLFRHGDVGRRIAGYDTTDRVIDEFFELLRRHEDSIVNVRRDDNAEHRAILAEFTDAGNRLRKLSIKILKAEEDRFAGVRDNVRDSTRLTWIVSMAALVLALLLIGIMLIETRRYRRMAKESADLATRAEAASQAKSRFLTMMSHELRTPMNGVLGLLALVRQTALNEGQARLVGQAERSGRQMSALLGDILDYSDLQSESLVMAREVFEVKNLAEAIKQMFGPIIQREGVSFTIEIEPDTPRWAVGDMARLRQALGHFVTFLVDVVGTRDVRLIASRGARGLLFEIDVAVQGDDQPGWQPEAVFGRSSGQYDEFASDSLGPMIARGLVTLMGGTVKLGRPSPGRAVLSVAIPVELIEGPAACIRIDAQSITVQMVLSALLRKLSQPVWDQGVRGQQVTAVLMEAGGADETTRAARLRSAHPAARLIATGTPRMPELFDCICPQPATADAIEAALSANPQRRRGEVS